MKKKETAYHITKKIYAFIVNDTINEERVSSLAGVFYSSNYNISKLLEAIFLSEWFAFGVAMIFAYLMLGIIDQIIGFDISYNKFLLNFLFTILAYPIFWYPITKLYA